MTQSSPTTHDTNHQLEYLHMGDFLKSQRKVHELRDELQLPYNGTIEHVAHLEKFLPQERNLDTHTKEFWLQLLAGALSADEFAFMLDDPLGPWLLQVLPQIGYSVELEANLPDNIAIAQLTNVAQRVHESILDLAGTVDKVGVNEEGKLLVPPLLRGHALSQLRQLQKIVRMRGVIDAQLILNCLAILYNAHDSMPEGFPDLRDQGMVSTYIPWQHTLYVDASSAWHPDQHQYTPKTITPAIINALRHYLVHYLDERIASHLSLAMPDYGQEDVVHFPYVYEFHNFLTP